MPDADAITETAGPGPDRSRWLPDNETENLWRDYIRRTSGVDGDELETALTQLRDYRCETFKEPSVEVRQAYQRLRDAAATTTRLHTETPEHEPVAAVSTADLALVLDALERHL
jgi:hypothetical protein